MTTILFHRLSKFGITCVQCNNEVIAPERSEYRNERQVRHLWRCGECDDRLEAEVTFSAAPKMSDLPPIPIFGPFGGTHLVIALDARYPELRKPME